MNAPKVSLPTDEELPAEAVELLGALPPLNIFRMVAGVPGAMRPFLELGAALLTSEGLDGRLREIAILRVANATGASYEWAQHEQIARSLGMPAAEIAALAEPDGPATLDPEARLVCRVADEISADVRLSDETLSELIDHFGERLATTLILCVAYYNMVSRFLESTRVQIEDVDLLGDQTLEEIVAEGEGAAG